MNIMSICDSADVLSVIRIIKIVITIIKIAVPIILILSLLLNYMSAVKSNDDNLLAAANKSTIPKLTAAILVFFIPTFVNILADVVSFNSDSYSNCISNANSEHISELIVNDAKIYLSLAKKTLTRADYNIAISKVKKIKDDSEREKYSAELKEIEEEIKKKEEEERKKREEQSNRGGSLEEVGDIPLGVSGSVENVLGVVYYNQCDKRWGNIKYDSGGATLCSSSCGYTSFAMIAAGLNNDMTINPYTVIKHMRNIKDGELTHRGYGAAPWGEIANNNKISKYNLSAQKISRSQIESSLNAGKPVLILVPGHYMVLSKSSAGNVVLLDPFTGWGSKSKKSGEYRSVSDIEKIYGAISSAAAYSRK